MHKPANSLQLAGSSHPAASFKELIVWQRAMDLAKEIYAVTKQLPASEQFGLTSQMRRAAVSVASNIAEGKRRGTKKDFIQFLRIADGSASELETQLLLAREVFPLKNTQRCSQFLSETQRMLGGMLKKLSLPAASSKLQTS
ncbi:MAG: S23 ribosomal protein, partial [Parcubacteria group bacterium Gr01-1014_49]